MLLGVNINSKLEREFLDPSLFFYDRKMNSKSFNHFGLKCVKIGNGLTSWKELW